jgi:hypothetical protein
VFTIIHSFVDGSGVTVRQPPAVTRGSFEIGPMDWTQVGLAIINPGDESQEIAIEARMVGVREPLRQSIRLAAGEQSVKLLSEVFPQNPGSAQDTTLWLQSARPFSGIALRLPKSGFRQLPLRSEELAAQGAVFPNVVNFGGWKTAIVLTNVSKSVSAGQLHFFTSDHQKWRMRLNGVESNVFHYSLGPGGTVRFDPAVPENAP